MVHENSQSSSWWRRRTSIERGLIVLLVLTICVACVGVWYAATSNKGGSASTLENDDDSHTDPEVCTSVDCVNSAARLMDSMDDTVDPCEDFYQYACGSWMRKNVIPDDKTGYSTFTQLNDEVELKVKALLEEDVEDSEPQATRMAKNTYRSCLNMSAIEARGDTPLQDLISWFGGWPVLDPQWDETSFDWIETVAKLRWLNNEILINQWVSADDKDSDVNIIQLDQPSLSLPNREYYLKGRDDPMLKAYEHYTAAVATLLGASEQRAASQMAEMIDFEIKLANITVPKQERRDIEKLYNRFTIQELYLNVTQDIDWLRYLNLVFSNASMSVNMTEEIVLYAPEYMVKLAELIEETQPRTIANYLIWRIVRNRVANLPQRFLDIRQAYRKIVYGMSKETSRWRECIAYTGSKFGMAVGRMFVEQHFDRKAKAHALEMIHEIRHAFGHMLDDLDWMEKDTKVKAREKARAMEENIGYPDYILNDTLLMKDYEGISISGKYFENVLSILNAKTIKNCKRLRQPVDKTKWAMAPAAVNAMYSPSKNHILFPVGILQPPFYSESFPRSMVFGGIGMVIGHEITHGFDDVGRQFDKDGNRKQWWSESDIASFKRKAQCIIDQYGNFTVPEIQMNVNGIITQGENIADNGGLKQAFKAYRHWVDRKGKEELPLPGINLNHNQLFFLNYAQIWCGQKKPERQLQDILTDPHSPKQFRVIGPVQNSQEFAQAFHCPVGSPMNPRKKCQVW